MRRTGRGKIKSIQCAIALDYDLYPLRNGNPVVISHPKSVVRVTIRTKVADHERARWDRPRAMVVQRCEKPRNDRRKLCELPPSLRTAVGVNKRHVRVDDNERSEGTRHELADDSDAPAPKQAESESRSAVKSPTSAPPSSRVKTHGAVTETARCC